MTLSGILSRSAAKNQITCIRLFKTIEQTIYSFIKFMLGKFISSFPGTWILLLLHVALPVMYSYYAYTDIPSINVSKRNIDLN